MYLNELPQKSYPSLMGFGGINTGVSPFNIADNEATEILNLSSDNFPAISVAKGDREIWYELNGQGDKIVKDIKYAGILFDGIPFFIGSVGGGDVEIYYHSGTNYDGSAAWLAIEGSAELLEGGTEFTSTAFSDDTTVIATGKKLISITESYKAKEITKQGDEPFPKDVNFVVTKEERLLTASTQNDALQASEYQMVQYINSDDFQIFHAQTEARQYATALALYGDYALYFKKNSTHILYGKTPDSYSFDTMSYSIGCVSQRSIAETDSSIMWLSKDGVYAYSATTLPYKISSPVQKYIDNMGSDASAVSDGKKYYLSLSQKDGSFVLLIYDTEFKVWHVRENIGYKMFIKQTIDENDKDIVLKTSKIIGSDGVNFYEIGTGDTLSEWHFVTKPFDMGGVAKGQNLRRIYLNIRAKKGAKLEVYISGKAEGDGFVSVKRRTYIKDEDEKLKIDIPVDKRIRNMPYFRIKISGGGDISVYGMELHQRIKPKTY